MKKLFISCLVVGAVVTGCSNNNPDSVKDAEKENGKSTDSLTKTQSVTDSAAIPSRQDADFMVKAASGGMMEVDLGKVAQSNGGSQGVKDFGAMMARDHGKGGEEIKSLALVKRIILPDAMSNDEIKKRDALSNKKGKDFDKGYVKLMVADHKDDIAEFEKAAQNANDPDIKAFASKTLPMLRQHLAAAEALEKTGLR